MLSCVAGPPPASGSGRLQKQREQAQRHVNEYPPCHPDRLPHLHHAAVRGDFWVSKDFTTNGQVIVRAGLVAKTCTCSGRRY